MKNKSLYIHTYRSKTKLSSKTNILKLKQKLILFIKSRNSIALGCWVFQKIVEFLKSVGFFKKLLSFWKCIEFSIMLAPHRINVKVDLSRRRWFAQCFHLEFSDFLARLIPSLQFCGGWAIWLFVVISSLDDGFPPYYLLIPPISSHFSVLSNFGFPLASFFPPGRDFLR